jgi:bifunctional ADP-heptose synthase (sugar kinase/adenylyltransferase)
MTALDSLKVEKLVKQTNILIIGDLLIDETWDVDIRKISPEAPVLTAYLKEPNPRRSPGGAGLASSYATKHEIPIIFLTNTNQETKTWLRQKKINVHLLEHSQNITKTRYIDTLSNYHVFRVDNDNIVPPSVLSKEKIISILQEQLKDVSSLILLDYGKGIFSNLKTTQAIIQLAKEKKIFTYVDTRRSVSFFKNVDFLKLNQNEYGIASLANHTKTFNELCKKLNISYLLITLGKNGAIFHDYKENTTEQYIPNLEKYSGIPDVTGCGDVFDINFCYYCFVKREKPLEAMKIAVEKATEFAYSKLGDRLC